MIRHCQICTNKWQSAEVDWKDAELLRRFMDENSKILAPRRTGTCAKHQRRVAKAIKRAREMGIVPYTTLVEK